MTTFPEKYLFGETKPKDWPEMSNKRIQAIFDRHIGTVFAGFDTSQVGFYVENYNGSGLCLEWGPGKTQNWMLLSCRKKGSWWKLKIFDLGKAKIKEVRLDGYEWPKIKILSEV